MAAVGNPIESGGPDTFSSLTVAGLLDGHKVCFDPLVTSTENFNSRLAGKRFLPAPSALTLAFGSETRQPLSEEFATRISCLAQGNPELGGHTPMVMVSTGLIPSLPNSLGSGTVTVSCLVSLTSQPKGPMGIVLVICDWRIFDDPDPALPNII